MSRGRSRVPLVDDEPALLEGLALQLRRGFEDVREPIRVLLARTRAKPPRG